MLPPEHSFLVLLRLLHLTLIPRITGPSNLARLESPPTPQNPNQMQPQAPQKPQKPQECKDPKEPKKPQEPQKPEPSKTEPGYGDAIDPDVVKAMVDAAMESINTGGPGMPAIGSPFDLVAQWPDEYSAAYEKVGEILEERARAAKQPPEKIEDYDDDSLPQGPASKKVKLDHRPRDNRQ